MSKSRIDTANIFTGTVTLTPTSTATTKILTVPSGTIKVLTILEDPIVIKRPTAILLDRLVPLNERDTLPVLPKQPQGYYNDINNPNQKWYYPEISLKTPAEGGFLFKCQQGQGVDENGKDIFKGELILRFRKTEPAAIRTLREKPGNTLVFKPIPVTYLSGAIVLKVGEKDFPTPISALVDAMKSDFDIVVSIAPNALPLWFRTLSDPNLGAALSIETQFNAWDKPSTPHLVELSALASSAQWSSGELVDADNTKNGAQLPWQGSDGDSRGFARLNTVYMEDGRAYQALRTHPKWAAKGTIKGHFPWKVLPKNARFEAKIGFVSGAKHTDGVTFQVWEHHYDTVAKKKVWNKIVHRYKAYDGKLVAIAANLAHLQGQNVGIELRVDAGASSGQDWAAWIEPRIVGDEYERRTVTEKNKSLLSYNCSKHVEFYRFKKNNGTDTAFGCTPPWDTDFKPDAPYIPYNKVDLANLGVSAVFKSILRDDQFLLVPSRYVIARDGDGIPEIFVSVNGDLEHPDRALALLDMKLSPDISDFQLLQIKKALVKSWDGADISNSIDLVFPNQVDSVTNENPAITPIVSLVGDDNYAHGVGNTLKLSLENLALQNASLLMRNIDEALGRNFPFKFKLGGNMAPVPSIASLTFKDLAGSFVLAGREGNTLKVANLLDRDVQVSQIVVEVAGRGDNLLLSVNQTLKAGELLALDLPEAARSGVDFAADYTVGAGQPYEIRDRSISTDDIRQDVTVDFSAFFKTSAVKSVEVTVQMKDSTNNVIAVFTAAKQTGLLTLRLPVAFYLAKRVVDYALRVIYQDPSKAEDTYVSQLDLREGSLLMASPEQINT